MIRSFIDYCGVDRVAGWVVDTERPGFPSFVKLIVNGAELARGEASNVRHDLNAVFGSSSHGFDFRFDPPLSPHRSHYVSLQLGDGSQVVRDFAIVGPSQGAGVGDGIAPILLSSTGRSGTTILMKKLGTDPSIVVAGNYPYEFKLLTYYAHALKVLPQPVDSLHDPLVVGADKLHEHPGRLGANPFFDPIFVNQFSPPDRFLDLFGRLAMGRLAATFASLTRDFYQEVGDQQGKVNPAYFIEKCDVLTDSRDHARIQFNSLKEIVLVRDLRDVFCSSQSFWSVGPGFMQNIIEAKDHLVRIKREMRPADTLLLRYEDLILDEESCIRRIAGFLGLGRPLAASTAEEDSTLFETHGTSTEPVASIGRWKRDLLPDQRALFRNSLSDFLETFGYDCDD